MSIFRSVVTNLNHKGVREISKSCSNHYPAPLMRLTQNVTVDHAQGSWIYATNGHKYLDWTCGIGVTSTGHCHPTVVKAIQDQAGKLIHGQLNCVTHQPAVQLAQKMAQVLPASHKEIFFANSGAEAVENAVKLARHATGRQNVIVFQGGFHGRTLGTGSLTTAKTFYRAGFQPLMSGVIVAPYPYCHRCPVRRAAPQKCEASDCCNDPLYQLNLIFKQQTAPFETAAILFEPILGEGGYVPAPPSFVKGLRKIANDTGAMLICDEVQSGYGRTGRMFAFEHYDVVPDIVVIAKGIAAGMPLSAIATTSDIMSKAKPGSMGGTYGGNAVSCAAGLAVLEVFEKENILQNVKARSQQMLDGLNHLKTRFPIGDIRGKGLMIGVEFADHVPAGTASAISQKLIQEHMLVLTAGVYETLRLIPPLTSTAEEVDIGLKKLEKVLSDTKF